MLRISAARFPRAEYRPLTAYEEFFGYKGAKRNANILFVFGVGMFLTLLKMGLAMNRDDRLDLSQTETDLIAEASAPGVLAERDRLILAAAKREQEMKLRGPR